MVDERDEERFGEAEGKTGGQENEHGKQLQQSGGPGPQLKNAQSDQPIGGNDSETRSGTTMSRGSGGAASGGQSSSGQTEPGGGTDTLTRQQGFGPSPSSSGQSSGFDQGNTGESVGMTGEGFIGSQGRGSDDNFQERGGANDSSGAGATRGPDFTMQDRGAPENEEDEESRTGSSSSGFGGGSGRGGSF
jgi:hypothetical protein